MGFALLKSSTPKTGIDQSVYRQMIDNMPVSVMICELEDFTITYANKSSINALKSLEHVLPVKADQIVGQSIDIFHKHPEHQRKLLADPKNLPHSAKISIGEEWLDLQVSALMDRNGAYIGPMLTWSIITDQVKQEQETTKLLQMLDEMPINVMLADKDSMEVTYINKTSVETLSALEHLLPCKASEIQGQCIDIFHKNPQHQRGMLADASRLPHRAVITLGEEKLELNVSALKSPEGEYLAPMLSWSVITDNVKMAENVSGVVSAVAAASEEMQNSATSLTSTADQTRSVASTVASATDELGSSIQEISRQVNQSTQLANETAQAADQSREMIEGLAQAAEEIGNVVTIIQDIAEKTNLLALNATIEAARAGEAGKGFAVVASEVKTLANQTAKATEDISQQIENIQNETGSAVEATQSISSKVEEINGVTSTIAAAIEQQNAATQEVGQNINQVSDASIETERMAKDTLGAAGELASKSDELQGHINSFLENLGVKN